MVNAVLPMLDPPIDSLDRPSIYLRMG